MNYIVVFSILIVFLVSMVSNVQATEDDKIKNIQIDEKRNLDNVETATFGLG